jgi:hypothetical protein
MHVTTLTATFQKTAHGPMGSMHDGASSRGY